MISEIGGVISKINHLVLSNLIGQKQYNIMLLHLMLASLKYHERNRKKHYNIVHQDTCVENNHYNIVHQDTCVENNHYNIVHQDTCVDVSIMYILCLLP